MFSRELKFFLRDVPTRSVLFTSRIIFPPRSDYCPTSSPPPPFHQRGHYPLSTHLKDTKGPIISSSRAQRVGNPSRLVYTPESTDRTGQEPWEPPG